MKPLIDELSHWEIKAAALAKEIRNRAKGSQEPTAEVSELSRELEQALTAAFVLKSKLEQAQLQALTERLNELQGKIQTRQGLSRQIISRRARELIEGEDLNWDSANGMGESEHKQSSSLRTQISDANGTTNGSPVVSKPDGELLRNKIELEMVLQTYGPKHPKVRWTPKTGPGNRVDFRWFNLQGELDDGEA